MLALWSHTLSTNIYKRKQGIKKTINCGNHHNDEQKQPTILCAISTETNENYETPLEDQRQTSIIGLFTLFYVRSGVPRCECICIHESLADSNDRKSFVLRVKTETSKSQRATSNIATPFNLRSTSVHILVVWRKTKQESKNSLTWHVGNAFARVSAGKSS